MSSYHLNPHVAARFCKRSVSCDKRRIQRFRQGQVSGVIGGQAVPHLPNAIEQDEMRIAGKWKIEEIREGFRTALGGDDARALISAQHLRDFQVDQMRSMQRLVLCEEKAVHLPGGGRLQENFKQRGSVDNDQRVFLSARTAAVGAMRGRTGWRLESRFRISLSVGRSRAWRSSRSK